MTERVLDKPGAEQSEEALIYALALRFGCLGDFTLAEKVAMRALDLSRERGNEIIQLRVASLLALTAANSHLEIIAERDDLLWELIQNSRHNCERLLICVTMSQNATQENRYFQGAQDLLEATSGNLIVLKAVTEALKTRICRRSINKTANAASARSILSTGLEGADRLFNELESVAERCVFAS